MSNADLLSLAAVIVGIVSAGVAWWQATEARKSRVRAEAAEKETATLAARATAAAERQAEAQEHANRLEEAARAPRPWSPPKWISGDLHTVANTSGRVIIVDYYDLEPEQAQKFFTIRAASSRFEVGDAFDYVAGKAMAVRPRKLTVNWHFEGETEGHQYIIPM